MAVKCIRISLVDRPRLHVALIGNIFFMSRHHSQLVKVLALHFSGLLIGSLSGIIPAIQMSISIR